MASYKQVQKLIQASLKGDVSTIEELLSGKKLDVNCKNIHKQFPLLVASQNGHKEAVKLLIERGAHVNMESRNKVTPLSLASECGHHETVQVLLENGAHIDHGVSDGRTPLMLASQNGHEETVRVLQAKNANVNACTDEKKTALFYALENKFGNVAKLLLPHVTDVDSRDSNGWTPLIVASSKGLSDVAKLLLTRGARVNLRTPKGSTALMLTCHLGFVEIALTLLEHVAHIDLQNDSGYSALIYASERGHKDTVELLLSHNAEVDLRTHSTRKTALIVASEGGHAKVVQLLCENMPRTVSKQEVRQMLTENKIGSFGIHICPTSLSINSVDNEGQTALSIASSRGDFIIAKTLVLNGADINQTTGKKSALSRAVASRNVDIVRLLLLNKASVHYEDLLVACRNGLVEIVRFLIPHCTSIDKDWSVDFLNTSIKSSTRQFPICSKPDKVSALWWAIKNGHCNVVNLLLENGASVDNSVMSGGKTPALVIATIREDVEIVQALLEKGAQVDVTCGRHQQVTPLMLAIFAGHTELVRLFIKHGAEVYFNLRLPYDRTSAISCMDLANAMGNRKIITILKEGGKQPPVAEQCNKKGNQKTLRTIESFLSYVSIVEVINCEYSYYKDSVLSRKSRRPFSKPTARDVVTEKSSEALASQKLLHLFPENESTSDETDELCTTNDQLQPTMCSPPTINDVYAILLPLASKWKNIGVLLKIEYSTLQTIEADKKDSQNALLEMVVEWLKRIDSPQPTWSELVEAVKPFDPTIAQKIQEKHCT